MSDESTSPQWQIAKGAIELPYQVVDQLTASFLLYYMENIKWRRTELSSGSCEYTVLDQGGGLLMAIELTASALDRIIVTISSTLLPKQTLLNMLGAVGHFVLREVEAAKKIPSVETLRSLSDNPMSALKDLRVPKKIGGNKPKNYNIRAWERLTAGEPRNAVYRDWLKDRGDDPDDPDVVEAGEDAFRKAIDRAKKREKKDGRT